MTRRLLMLLAQRAFHSDMRVVRKHRLANTTTVLELHGLVAKQGSELDLEARGPEFCAAISAVAHLVRNGFRNFF